METSDSDTSTLACDIWPQLVTRRTNLKRRFTRISNRLQSLIESRSPVRRYLEPDVRELEFVRGEINRLLEDMRRYLEGADDTEGLNALDAWAAKFDSECLGTLNAACTILESPPSLSPRVGSAVQGVGPGRNYDDFAHDDRNPLAPKRSPLLSDHLPHRLPGMGSHEPATESHTVQYLTRPERRSSEFPRHLSDQASSVSQQPRAASESHHPRTGTVYPDTAVRDTGRASSVSYMNGYHGPPRHGGGGQSQSMSDDIVSRWAAGVRPPGGISALHHLKPLECPKFTGKASEFVKWKQSFTRLVDEDPYVSQEFKLARLKEALQGGSAEDIVGEMFDGPGAYTAAWVELERWYGGSDRHLAIQEQELLNHAKIQNERDTDMLRKFAVKLRNVLMNLELSGAAPGRELFLLVVGKLPRSLVVKFYETHNESQCSASELADWLIRRVVNVKRADDILASGEGEKFKPSRPKEAEKGRGPQFRVGTYSTSAPATKDPSTTLKKSSTGCAKCRKNHGLAECSEFKSLPVKMRWSLVRLLNLCSCCLEPGHWARDCRKPRCSHCDGGHHSLLHSSKPAAAVRVGSEKPSGNSDSKQSEEVQHVQVHKSNTPSMRGVSFMTVPVVLVGKAGQRVKCVAMLDSGSTASFVREDLMRSLGLHGVKRGLTTSVIGGRKIEGQHEYLQLLVESTAGDVSTELSAWVLNEVTSSAKLVDWNQCKDAWDHLKGVDFPPVSGKKIGILIGLNAVGLHTSLEERTGDEGDPIARRTPLGWVCMGPLEQDATDQSTYHCDSEESQQSEDAKLSVIVEKFWDVEEVGIHRATNRTRTLDEKLAEQLVESTASFQNGRMRLGIPWKCEGGPAVESNRPMAERRLAGLERSLDKRPTVRDAYEKVIESHCAKGYVRQVPDLELTSDEPQWYLPHFPVVRDDKVTTKVRVVFDAAATWNGRSINDEMLTGPALQNDLVRVLLQFCMEPVAIIGDISEMFLQVELAECDRKYHRFLWKSAVYEFNRLVFGIKSSPYLACKALQEVAKMFAAEYPESAHEIVSKNFYVDDLLCSLPTVEEAVTMRKCVQEMLERGGFHLRKWLSNERAVIESVPEDDRAPNSTASIADHSQCDLPSVKTLGVAWSAEKDTFTFAYSTPRQLKYTRRDVLSKMAAIYDPRGQIAPFTVRARVLFQEACILGYGWDDLMAEEQQKKWSKWFEELPSLSQVQVPRCFKVRSLPADTCTLTTHVFTDASEAAYAAVVYIRAEYPDDTVQVTLAMARARPSPIRKLTIPKLELKGAVLGVNLAREVNSALDIASEDTIYWTDSMNVLFWVRSRSRKFRTDIANRIADVQEYSSGRQWRHVPGRLNPADKGTRGLLAPELADDSVWWHGPAYLLEPMDVWPDRLIAVPRVLPGQLKSQSIMSFHAAGCYTEPSSFPLHPDNISSWSQLVRLTAWCLRFINSCRRRVTRGVQKTERPAVEVKTSKTSHLVPTLSVSELQGAEYQWIAIAQRDVYASTIAQLSDKKPLMPSDPLIRLQPVLDTSHDPPLLRVAGLKSSSHLPSNTRRPVILPQKHRVTELIIDNEDRRCGHSVGKSSNTRGKVATRAHRAHCVCCKKKWAAMAKPEMAPLPTFRTAPPFRAFSRVGIDYAGPVLTKQGRGRTQCKRYLLVVTCLQSRACHLEVAYGLDTESFIKAFTRFAKRRGAPSFVLSDNGTNFVGAERELRQAVQALNNVKVASSMTSQGIEWHFNPPQAPHFGGVFENNGEVSQACPDDSSFSSKFE